MFSRDLNGYNRQEVDEYIASLKASHEKALMEEKLKVLEAERKVLDLRNKTKEIEDREKNIKSVFESFKKMQLEGNNNIEMLRGEQLRLIYIQIQEFMRELNNKYPGVLVNSTYKKLVADIQTVLTKNEARTEQTIAGTENDSMRILLSKMQEKRVQENPKEIRIERTNDFRERTIQIKPVTEMELKAGDGYDNLVDKFLASKPDEEQPKAMPITSNGFDLKEAVTPKDDLSEIMKAFDFFNNDDEE